MVGEEGESRAGGSSDLPPIGRDDLTRLARALGSRWDGITTEFVGAREGRRYAGDIGE